MKASNRKRLEEQVVSAWKRLSFSEEQIWNHVYFCTGKKPDNDTSKLLENLESYDLQEIIKSLKDQT